MRETYDAREVARDAARVAGMSDSYDDNTLYPNPAKNAFYGMSFNWHNNLVPPNVVNFIAAHDTLGEGVAEASLITLENTLNHRYFTVDYTVADEKNWFIGIAQELAKRDGLGAFGEMWAERNILSGVEAPREGDEARGIDLRSDGETFQVKTGEDFKSNWEKCEADHLIWIQTEDGSVVDWEMR